MEGERRIDSEGNATYSDWLRNEISSLPREWWGRLSRLSWRLGLSSEETEDAIQMAVLRLLQGERRLSSEVPIERYILHTLRWVAADISRKRWSERNRQYSEPADQVLENVPAIGGDLGDRLELAQVLDMLASREREVAELIAEGYLPAEIATQLGIDASTVRSTIRHVRAKLTKMFNKLDTKYEASNEHN